MPIFDAEETNEKTKITDTKVDQWLLCSAILLIFIIGIFGNRGDLFLRIAGSIGFTIIPGVLTLVAYKLTALMQNRPIARIFFILLFLGILFICSGY